MSKRHPIPQRLINRCTKAANAFQVAQSELLELCREQYGCEPGDIDCDDIIDSVLGAAGRVDKPMTSRAFDDAMRASMEREGVSLP